MLSTPGFSDIVTLDMMPYGNAHGTGTAIQCQHGPTECKTNMVEDCAIRHLPDTYMSFVFCAESHARRLSPDAIITTCSNGTAAADITSCYGGGSGEEGVSLQTATAAKTKTTNHKYTPWLLINDEHSTAAESDLKKAICAAYTGSNPPAACAKSTESSSESVTMVSRCHLGESEFHV
jgi:interferon gamma-inducible protein 30